jgi:hypothetical protein
MRPVRSGVFGRVAGARRSTYLRAMVEDLGGGLLRIVLCVVLVAAVVGGVLYSREIAALTVRVGRFLHLLPPPPPTRAGPPLERIVRDLHRLRPEARRPGRGTPEAKLRGVLAAYDDLLLDACRAVGVPTELASLPEGIERESERLRVEYELERAGIPIRAAS